MTIKTITHAFGIALLSSLLTVACGGDIDSGQPAPGPTPTNPNPTNPQPSNPSQPSQPSNPNPPDPATPPSNPPPPQKPQDPPPSQQCPDLTGKWTGEITGIANTFLPNIAMVGTIVMNVSPGQSPNDFTMTHLSVSAWSTLLPSVKVPLTITGSHKIQCNKLDIKSPIVVEGVNGKGTVTGTCNATHCTGKFSGATDDGTMDAKGDFKLTKK